MPPRKKTKLPTRGDCYEAAGRFLLDSCVRGSDCTYLLVHGEVAGQGPLDGITYGHAWVLDGETVIDKSNGRNLQIPRILYYALGGIDHLRNLHTYTWEQAREKILQHKHWGPWDLKTRSGL
jgi:hypothetical protein